MKNKKIYNHYQMLKDCLLMELDRIEAGKDPQILFTMENVKIAAIKEIMDQSGMDSYSANDIVEKQLDIENLIERNLDNHNNLENDLLSDIEDLIE